ncbi:hypothetical protein MKW98_007098 [Papaver atlanticum]|uniref:Domain X domain-containing protein n=1 Tax=Papaver atlanticum TaxID=357466 RepID=A0AAD4TD34_9MAGN|nr:hypothetical protein MKW98_007098 [Papaver atlanticum]
MKEAIRMVPESIYDSEFPDTSHFRSGRGCHSALRRIKEEWGTSRWFLEFDIRKHIIDRHRLIPILKEEIDDPKFFYHTQKLLGAGRRKMNGPDSVPHSVLLSALPGNIYLHKLDQEIGRIRHKYEIPMRIRSVLSQFSGRIDDQAVEEASFNAPQDNGAIFLGRVKSIQRKAAFHSLVSSWHTPPTSTPLRRGDQKTGGASALAAFLNKPSPFLVGQESKKTPSGRVPYGPSLFLCAAVPKAEFYGRERKNSAMRDRKISRRGLLIELGGEARPVIRSERRLARKPLKDHDLIRICYVRYADDLLLGVVGALELLIEIQKRLTHFLQSGLNLWSAGSTAIAARSTVEFPGTVIREVPHSKQVSPIQFLREQEKRLRVKHRIHITACHLRSAIHSQFRNLGKSLPIKELTRGMSGRRSLLDAVQLAETLGTAGVRSPQVSVLWGTVKHIRQEPREISFLHSSDRSKVPSDAVSRSGMSVTIQKLSLYTRKAAGERREHWAGSFSSEFPIQIEAPIKKILRRLRDRGLISRRRPWPIHVACLTNVSDGDIVNRSADIAISPLSYYRCRDNFSKVRTIVDHQIRWSAIFTPAHKHKTSARNIILKYSKDSSIVSQEGGKTLAEFPNSIELGKLGPGHDPTLNY